MKNKPCPADDLALLCAMVQFSFLLLKGFEIEKSEEKNLEMLQCSPFLETDLVMPDEGFFTHYTRFCEMTYTQETV